MRKPFMVLTMLLDWLLAGFYTWFGIYWLAALWYVAAVCLTIYVTQLIAERRNDETDADH